MFDQKTKLLILLVMWPILSIYSQALSYEPLISEGQLPIDLTLSPLEKYEQLKNAPRSAGANTAETESFLLETTYLFDDLLRSGYIIYNDPLGIYVNEVLQVVLDENPTLAAKKPRAYILKSTEVNAFAVDQGVIIVSLGLLAHLESEAQLAFILAHELVHIKEEHVLDGFLEANKIEQEALGEKIADGQNFDLVTSMKNSYSREQEVEADKNGADYFLQTNYAFEDVGRVFEILRYSHMPYENIAFEFSSLEKGTTILPQSLMLDTVAAITVPEENELESSHPALDSRKSQLYNLLRLAEKEGRLPSLVSEERFALCQQRARMELPLLHLVQQELPQAIYTAFLLEKKYGENEHAQELIGKALYGIAKFKNNDEWSNLWAPSWRKVEGEAQQLFYLIKKLSRQELTILALVYNYDLYAQQSDNEALRDLLIDLFAELYIHHRVKSVNFFKPIDEEAPQKWNKDTTLIEEEIQQETLQEEKPIRKRDINRHNSSWQYYVFADVLDDPLFQQLSDDGFTYGKERTAEIGFYDITTAEGRRNSYRASKRRRKRGASLGINKAIVINPIYLHLDLIKEEPVLDRSISASQLEIATEILKFSADKLDVDLIFLDADELGATDTDVLNDIAVAQQWISTQVDAEGFIYHAYDKTAADRLVEKYDTPYLVTVALVSGRYRSGGESLVFVIVFDLNTGRRSYIKTQVMGNYLNTTYMQSELYDAIFQLSKTR